MVSWALVVGGLAVGGFGAATLRYPQRVERLRAGWRYEDATLTDAGAHDAKVVGVLLLGLGALVVVRGLVGQPP